MASGRVPLALRTRPWTPDRRDPETGATTVTMKRVCNGCQVLLGDVTEAEVTAAIGGRLPDVTAECPFCSRMPAP